MNTQRDKAQLDRFKACHMRASRPPPPPSRLDISLLTCSPDAPRSGSAGEAGGAAPCAEPRRHRGSELLSSSDTSGVSAEHRHTAGRRGGGDTGTEAGPPPPPISNPCMNTFLFVSLSSTIGPTLFVSPMGGEMWRTVFRTTCRHPLRKF